MILLTSASRGAFRVRKLPWEFVLTQNRIVSAIEHNVSSYRSRSSTTRSVLLASEMPSCKVDKDGNPIGPLKPYIESKPNTKGRQKESTPTAHKDGDHEADYLAAVAAGEIPETPLAKLVWTNWKRFPDCVLLTQVGNFYESYFEPAIQLSALLGIKLTSKVYKSGSFPFTGFPIHQRDKYLKLLVHDLGYTVALIDEEKDPLSAKNTVTDINRKVARIVTPGTLVDETWLSGSENRYLLAIAVGDPSSRNASADSTIEAKGSLYLAYADVSTGEFFTKDATLAQIEDELARIAPREVVLDAHWREAWLSSDLSLVQVDDSTRYLLDLLKALGVYVSFADLWTVSSTTEKRRAALPLHAKTSGPTSLEDKAIALLRTHLEYALRDSLPTMPDRFIRQTASAQMQIDAATLQALEIRHALRPGGLVATSQSIDRSSFSSPISVKGTLLSVITRTVTDSGYRLLKRTLSAPSTSLSHINARLALVQALIDREPLRTDLRDALQLVSDVMRVIQRFKAGRGDGSDVWEVARWVRAVEKLIERIRLVVDAESRGRRRITTTDAIQSEGVDRLKELLHSFAPLVDLATTIENAIDEAGITRSQSSTTDDDDPEGIEAAGEALIAPMRLTYETRKEGEERKRVERERSLWWIKPSFSPELRNLHRKLAMYYAQRDEMEKSLRLQFSALSLALGQSARGGFVVTVKRKAELGKLERSSEFHTVTESRSTKVFAYLPWTTLGSKIEAALEILAVAQARALNSLRAIVVERAEEIQINSELVDEIDLTMSFALTAIELHYVRPVVHDGTELLIINGRHPSVEAGLFASARSFTPNTTIMTPSSHLHVITGPNQGGKSTLLRQTAVISILAQSGSFVPAERTELGIVDRVFSRIGARDDLFRDRSTFMLEMVETAAILKQATPRSLVIMDEIGRGTTLHAGVSIAYATLDYILKHIHCRTLFATHYHELGQMLGAQPPDKPDNDSNIRKGVSFWCTDVVEMDGSFTYSYVLRKGINYNSHAIKAAELAGMPESFIETAKTTLTALQGDEPNPIINNN